MLLSRSCNYLSCIRSKLNYFAKRYYSYESDGKTTLSFLSKESEDRLLISSFNQLGFRLNSGLFVIGPIVIFPRTLLSWNVANDDDVNDDSLSLFCNLEPKLDLLVIGLGDTVNSFKNQNNYFSKLTALKQTKLNIELLPTENAIATYNFLTSENRFVAAALIPPKVMDFSEYNFGKFVNVGKVMEGKDDYLFGDDLIEDESETRKKLPKFRKRIDDSGSEPDSNKRSK